MNTNLVRKPLTTALFCLACNVPVAGAAVNDSNLTLAYATRAPSVTVKYSDLDINRGSGAETLYQRLRSAARQVCGSYDGRNLNAADAWKACYEQALDEAVNDVGNPRLSELHNG